MYPIIIKLRVLTLVTLLLISPSLVRVASATAPTNACALLSQAQAAAALGVEVDAGKNLIGVDDCRWAERGKTTGADIALLQVNLTKPRSFEIGKTPLSGWSKPTVTGVGDDAYFADNGKASFPVAPSLSVKKGSVFVVIIAKVPKATVEQTKDAEKKVASAILEKL